MQTIGQRLKYLRKKKNMTQEQVSTSIYVDRQTYMNYESDRTIPDGSSLVLLSKTFSASADYILGLSNRITPYESTIDLCELFYATQKLTLHGEEITNDYKELVINSIEHTLKIINTIKKK